MSIGQKRTATKGLVTALLTIRSHTENFYFGLWLLPLTPLAPLKSCEGFDCIGLSADLTRVGGEVF